MGCLHAQAQPSADQYLAGPPGNQEVAQALKKCDDGSARQFEINICALDRFRKADVAYQAAASAVKQDLAADSGMQTALDNANVAFKRFRDATCSFDRAGIGQGTMAPTIEFTCLAIYTEHRAKALAEYAACSKTGDCEQPNLLFSYEIAAPDAEK
jgi:uncharacterized protein YecT (DUF1311 family)